MKLAMSAEQERLLSEGIQEESPPRRKSSRKSRKKKKSFGVRDNLENFYNEEVDEWSADGVILENQTALRRRLLRLPAWKGIAFAGGVLMSISVLLLAVGHGIPRQEPVLGDKDGIELIRTSALTFNKILRTCQIVGLALFCSGGFFVAGGLLIGAFCAPEDLEGSRHSLLESFVVSVPPETPRLPQETKVPVTQSLAPVQPAASVSNAAAVAATVVSGVSCED
ncbi:neurensin-1 [Galendromus occidentalis]|uniref:Neurensin-1 n=1 Tax=Galendromus occidentalis TaxID=34638 RepID=A0AAJ6QXN5_9ACAR|nr:neurensin-1 [Galendromus occidentalis]